MKTRFSAYLVKATLSLCLLGVIVLLLTGCQTGSGDGAGHGQHSGAASDRASGHSGGCH